MNDDPATPRLRVSLTGEELQNVLARVLDVRPLYGYGYWALLAIPIGLSAAVCYTNQLQYAPLGMLVLLGIGYAILRYWLSTVPSLKVPEKWELEVIANRNSLELRDEDASAHYPWHNVLELVEGPGWRCVLVEKSGSGLDRGHIPFPVNDPPTSEEAALLKAVAAQLEARDKIPPLSAHDLWPRGNDPAHEPPGIEFELPLATLAYAQLYRERTRQSDIATGWFQTLTGCIGLTFAALLWIISAEEEFFFHEILGFVAIFLIWLGCLLLHEGARNLPISPFCWPRIHYLVRLLPGGCLVTRDGGASLLRWDKLPMPHENEDFFFVQSKEGRLFLPIPRTAFTSFEAADQFLSLLRQHYHAAQPWHEAKSSTEPITAVEAANPYLSPREM